MTELAAALTPAPVQAPPAAMRFRNLGRGWQSLGSPDAIPDQLARLDPWAVRNLDGCIAIERGWSEAVRGDCLAHGDIRADNILLAGDRVVFVDWPWACVGPPWFDLVGMLPSVFLWLSGQPDPPGLPTLRAFQRAQGIVALDWLKQRTGWR